MELVPVRFQPPARTGPAASRGATRAPAAAAAQPAAAVLHATTAHATKAPAHPATAEDADLIERQAAFDRFMQLRSELDREANALRELAMEQINRDDAFMNAWIKLI
jgi:hypothetical protein